MHALETFIAHMTIAELATKTGKSITEIAELAVNGKAKNFPLKPIEVRGETIEAKPKKVKSKKSKINVRTPEGRAEYDEAVFTAVSEHGDFIGAEELRPIVGGEPTQLRAALKRLVADKRLTSKGQARATKYGVKTTKAKGKKKAPPRVAKTKDDGGQTLDVRILKYLRKRNAIATKDEIAEALEVSKGSVTKALKGMEIDGNIESKDRPKDGASGFVITAKGKKAY